jgi:hypothetical protein
MFCECLAQGPKSQHIKTRNGSSHQGHVEVQACARQEKCRKGQAVRGHSRVYILVRLRGIRHFCSVHRSITAAQVLAAEARQLPKRNMRSGVQSHGRAQAVGVPVAALFRQ